MQEECIKNEEWIKMLNVFKTIQEIYIGEEKNLKRFIEAIFWMARSGASWRFLPKEYGDWNSIFKRFNEWSKKGIWERLFKSCIQDPDMEYVLIDSTVVRAHVCAAGIGDHKKEGLGRSPGGFTTKIHAAVDALGNPLKFLITLGNCSDFTQAEKLLPKITDAFIIGDKGYDSDSTSIKTYHKLVEQTYHKLVEHIQSLNKTWIEATRRKSPQIIIMLLEYSEKALYDFFKILDPISTAYFPVAWAGEQESLNWFDIARECTEKWHHQMQIRLAVKKIGIKSRYGDG